IGVGQGRAVDEHDRGAGERGQLLAQVRRDRGQVGRGTGGRRRGEPEGDDSGRTGGERGEEASMHAPTTTGHSRGHARTMASASSRSCLTMASGSSAEYTAEPATKTSAPASAHRSMVSVE